MQPYWEGITTILSTSILQTSHRTNIFSSYKSNSQYESDYDCICIVMNGKNTWREKLKDSPEQVGNVLQVSVIWNNVCHLQTDQSENSVTWLHLSKYSAVSLKGYFGVHRNGLFIN